LVSSRAPCHRADAEVVHVRALRQPDIATGLIRRAHCPEPARSPSPDSVVETLDEMSAIALVVLAALLSTNKCAAASFGCAVRLSEPWRCVVAPGGGVPTAQGACPCHLDYEPDNEIPPEIVCMADPRKSECR